MNDFTHISIRLAAALLLQRGEISISDIQALPFVENDDAVKVIVESLSSIYHVERCQYRAATHKWEDILRIRYPTKDRANPGSEQTRVLVDRLR